MLVVNSVFRQGMASAINPGDTVLYGDYVQSLTTVGAGTLTAAILLGGLLRRTGPVGNYNETTDSAANIVAAIAAQQFQGSGSNVSLGATVGSTWRFREINTVAFVATLVAGANVNLVGGNTAIAASSVKEYLLTVVNGTPAVVLQGDTVNGSAVVSMSGIFTQRQLDYVTAGMAVSGTGIAANTTVLAVQPNKGITLSQNATATNSATVLSFNPVIQIESLGQFLL